MTSFGVYSSSSSSLFIHLIVLLCGGNTGRRGSWREGKGGRWEGKEGGAGVAVEGKLFATQMSPTVIETQYGKLRGVLVTLTNRQLPQVD